MTRPSAKQVAREFNVTDLDRLALACIERQPHISSQALTNLMGLKRTCGAEFHPQGAGRIGAMRGARLVKMGLAKSWLVPGGYCNGFTVTDAGRALLGEGWRNGR